VIGVLGHQLKALRMRLDRDDLGVGPVVMGHHGKTPHVRADIDNRAHVVGTQIVDAVLVMEYRVGELNTLGLDVEVLPINLVANRVGHFQILLGTRHSQGMK